MTDHTYSPLTTGQEMPVSGENEFAPQIQQRLLQLTNQLDMIQGQLDRLASTTRLNSEQVAALTGGLTDPLAGETTRTKLAQLTAHLVDNQDALDGLRDLFLRTSTKEQDLLQQLQHLSKQQSHLNEQQNQLSEQQRQLEPFVRATVQSEQFEELTQNLASQAQIDQARIDEVLNTIKKLNRTQFKSNAITESKEGQVSEAISTLQTIVNRRDELQTDQSLQEEQRFNEIRDAARGEFAAVLFPALDGLELAIAKGHELKQRLQNKQGEAAISNKAKIVDLLQRNREPIDSNFWKRMRETLGATPNAPALERNMALDTLTQALMEADISTEAQSVVAVESWLDGLALVRDRFLKLFATEEITTINAEGQPFDPHIHVAIETEVRDDVEPDTVVRVLQQGYRQRERILRYAEVVVARKPDNHVVE